MREKVLAENRKRKLALSDDILLTIEKPARYIGGEINAVYKDLSEIDIRFCMCFPDVSDGAPDVAIYCCFDSSEINMKWLVQGLMGQKVAKQIAHAVQKTFKKYGKRKKLLRFLSRGFLSYSYF